MTQMKPVILGIDEDRAAQMSIAQTFNEQGLFYRFVTDRRKVIGGIKQLKPHLLLVFGEMESDFVIKVLDALSGDAEAARRPIVITCNDTSDAEFVKGMRTGVVGLLAAPFSPAHIGVLKALYEEVSTRTGSSSGTADAVTLIRFVEHIRRSRRSGILVTNPRAPNEARATFICGKLDRASFLGAHGQQAVNAMLNQPLVKWTFAEVAGSHSEGTGVVIEVGGAHTGEVPIAEVMVSDDEPLPFEMPAHKPELPPPSGALGMRARLLLVDDEKVILKMFATFLTKQGFEVTTANDGNEGFEAALVRPFDVAVADLNMPHLDGWGMLRAIREDFRTRELPIAFLSAHDDYRDSLRALDAGAQAYLSKSTKLDVVASQVTKLLEPRRAVLAAIDLGAADNIAVQTVGPQWLLRSLSAKKFSGELTCRDGWAAYRLGFDAGLCVHASALAGQHKAQGERALTAFIACRSSEGSLSPGAAIPPQNLALPTETLIERACAVLNENERRMRESLMLTATEIEVNQELYALYCTVGPKRLTEAAVLICEKKMTPREIIAKVEISPMDVEECMKDLMRRGVVTLKKAKDSP